MYSLKSLIISSYIAMLALFLSNRLLSCDCNRNAAEKYLGLEANIGSSYGGRSSFVDDDNDDDHDDDDDDDADDDEYDGKNESSVSYSLSLRVVVSS